MPNTIAQWITDNLDEMIMTNVEIAAFYKTLMMYIKDEMLKRGCTTFHFEIPIEVEDGEFRMKIHYGG